MIITLNHCFSKWPQRNLFVYLKKNRIEKVVVVVPTYRANSISVKRVQKTAFIHRLHTGKKNTRYQRSRNKCEKNPKVNILGFETTIKNGFERVFFSEYHCSDEK